MLALPAHAREGRTKSVTRRTMSESPELPLGGGAINEKERQPGRMKKTDPDGVDGAPPSGTWDPTNNLSHMLHALVGLDRYPNYLSRFHDEDDVVSLEAALEARLMDVRKQKQEIANRRRGIAELVGRYLNRTDCDFEAGDCSQLWWDHEVLSKPDTWADLRERRVLQDSAFRVAHRSALRCAKRQGYPNIEVRDAIDGKLHIQIDASLLEEFMDQAMFDVYSFPIFEPEFCKLLRQTVRDLSWLADKDFPHLNLGRRPLDLDDIGLGWINDLLFAMFIQPISRHLFATTEILAHGEKDDSEQLLDWRQGYIAGYSASPTSEKGVNRHRLNPHTDDSEVTLNVCLGEETFEGGSVEFYGLRGTAEEGELVGKARRPDVGTALIHSGRHLHAVSDITKGDRYAYIIWSRAWRVLRSRSCPCCYLNRRQSSRCICDKAWN